MHFQQQSAFCFDETKIPSYKTKKTSKKEKTEAPAKKESNIEENRSKPSFLKKKEQADDDTTVVGTLEI